MAAVVACALFATGAAARPSGECNRTYEYCNPGRLPAGVYTTRYFLPGMRVSLPGAGWSSPQDSTTELRLHPPGFPAAAVLRFWVDPRVGTPCTDRVLPIRLTTPAGAVRWLRGNPNFVVSVPRRTTIAGNVAALTVDLDLSPRAPRCDPSCPGPCVDYFLFFGGTAPDATDLAPGHTAGIKDGFGSGRGQPVRLYFAAIGHPSHLFVVGVDTPSKRVFTALTASMPGLLARLRLPRTPR